MQLLQRFNLILIFNLFCFTLLAQQQNDSTGTAAANANFANSSLAKFFMGKHYRQEWVTPVTAPVFDINTFKGGLTILKQGGGFQTKSLRLQDSAGIQYNLRTIDKFPGQKLPSAFRGTWVAKAAKDQISTAHPYAFLAVPVLAEAIGVYHTKPKLVYVPKEAPLGDFAKLYGDKPFMIEIRPDEDLSGFDRFGNSKNVVGTEKMYEHLIEDNDNEVDQEAFLKARLFDMVIGDWDRHNDQWRWAEYEKDGKGSIFRAIPRDRDQVFVILDGLLPTIGASRFAFRRVNHFGHTITDIKGTNWAGRNLDRNLLNELSLETWLSTARFIQSRLTDEVITEAIDQLPPEVRDISGDEIIAKVKSRRDDLEQYARAYYLILAEEVRITGSEKHERFIVQRLDDEKTKLTVYKTEKDGDLEKKLYERIFYTSETKEIHLFGLAGHDDFQLSGEVNSGIRIRIVGGEEADTFLDESSVAGATKKTIIYDNRSDKDNIVKSTETRTKTSSKDWVNAHQLDYHSFDYLGPRLSFELNPDDGLFLGAGVYWKDQGFRKDPASDHLLNFNVATRTRGWNAGYTGNIYSLFAHRWDLAIEANGHNDKYAFNYFGLGNSTENTEDIDFYRVSLAQANLSAMAVKRFGRTFRFGVGPAYQFAQVDDTPNTILEADGINSPFTNTESKHMLGARLFTDLHYADHPVHPSKGIRWRNEVTYLNELNGSDVNFGRLSSELSLYYTPNLPFRMTIATRFGVNQNVGDFLFYQSNFLGGQENLRGFRRTRFAGKGSAFQNTEIRLSLFNIKNVFMNGDFGLIGFIDHAKVWADDVDESDDWNRTYGPGAYLHFYEYVVLSAHYGFTQLENENFFLVRMGFLF